MGTAAKKGIGGRKRKRGEEAWERERKRGRECGERMPKRQNKARDGCQLIISRDSYLVATSILIHGKTYGFLLPLEPAVVVDLPLMSLVVDELAVVLLEESL